MIIDAWMQHPNAEWIGNVTLSQWGNSIFGIMTRLNQNGGDQAVRAAFQKTMSGDFDNASGAPYTPLELLVMELFRTISPNGGSISAITDTRASSFYGGSPFAQFGVPYERHSYMNTPHTETQQIIQELADQGTAVVVISSYLPEVLNLADRLLVWRGGRVVEELSPKMATEERVMYASVH